MLVKSLLKQRWWWMMADSMDTANLVWTQWKKNRIMKLMPMIKISFKDDLGFNTTTSTELGTDNDQKDNKKKSPVKEKIINDSTKNGFLRLCISILYEQNTVVVFVWTGGQNIEKYYFF